MESSIMVDLQSAVRTYIIPSLAVVGSAVVIGFIGNVIGFFYAHFLRPSKNIKRVFGSWAVVTGATDGIGKAMAFEFARKGVNVVIISRSKEKLVACAEEIKAKYPDIGVKTLDIDYGNFDAAARSKVAEALKGLDVGVLVNNVGISYPYTKYFHELDDDRVQQLITLNVDSTTWMTRIVLPDMITRKRGAIINIGSAAGVSNSPLLAQYGAAKSYIAMFSRAMNVELHDKGINVQCQVPMFVATKLAKIKHTSLFVPSPSGYARAAVASIGYEALISPYWTHAIQIWLLSNLPESVVAAATKSMHLGIRAAGMKKDAKQSAATEAASKQKST